MGAKMFAVTAVLLLIPTQESEVEMLKNQLRETQLELAEAKRKIRRLEAQLAAAEDAGFTRDTTAMTSVIPILKRIPAEFQPAKNLLWDSLESKQINDHLRSEVGKRFQFKARVSSATIAVNSAHLRDNSQPKYKATVKFLNPRFANSGAIIIQQLYAAPLHPTSGTHYFYGDDKFRLQFSKQIRPKSFVTIEGDISNITVKRSTKNEITFRIGLINKSFRPSFLE